jgi:homoserine O-acetyltransferase/O-succinyltransferase
LRGASLSYVTRGRLNDARDNVVLFPTYYTGTHRENLALVGPGRALDPERYFVVIVNLFGNGQSSSPSNHPSQGGSRFPAVSLMDNVRAQWRLLEQLGVERLALAFGWSMGAQQAYHHAALFPERVERLLAVCGSARTAPHNWVFLEGVKAALQADQSFASGDYTAPPRRGLAAFGRVYAGWAYSQAFFRERLYERLGHASPEALLAAWERDHLAYDANDLLCVLRSWQSANIADGPAFDGDLARALGAITARAIIMPCRTDLYFPPEKTAASRSSTCNEASCASWNRASVTSRVGPTASPRQRPSSKTRCVTCSILNEGDVLAALLIGHRIEALLPFAKLMGQVNVAVKATKRAQRQVIRLEGFEGVQQRAR